ncbi:MAG: hypothetical protein A2Y70_00460, partial [Candidatus Aminicenantes bacterium RBG_13_64_14]
EQTKAQAQVKAQLKAKGEVQQNKVQAKATFRHRVGTKFIDENGDGINDVARDADGDGIPNGQDPDWTRPLDGSGYKDQRRVGRTDGTETVKGQKAGKITKANFGKASFRQGATTAGRMAGAGVCDGTGPKGAVQRKGRG